MEDKKVKVKSNFGQIDLLSYEPTQATEIVTSGKDYVLWGDDNRFPIHLYDVYSNCATLQSIINGSIDYTVGDKINNNTPLREENQIGKTLEDIIEKLIVDRWIFGGFCFQIIYNNAGEISQIAYISISKCRLSKDRKHVYYIEDWSKRYSMKSIRYAAYNPETAQEDKTQIFFYSGNRTRGYYPICDYSAALVSAETQIDIQNFHWATINNNFMVNGILNFNNADNVSQENKEAIEKAINNKFSGVRNAGRLMLSWNPDKDHGVEFQRLTDDQFDKKYEALATSTRENLFIAMRAIPVLFGLSVQTGFNTQEYEEAFTLYNRTAVRPKQAEITRIFDKIFGIENSISFDEFKLNVPTQIESKEGDNMKKLSVPSEILADLTKDERRKLGGFEPLGESGSSVSILAERLGVGGTEAFIRVVTDTLLTLEQKRGTLKTLFNLSDEQINTLFPTV